MLSHASVHMPINPACCSKVYQLDKPIPIVHGTASQHNTVLGVDLVLLVCLVCSTMLVFHPVQFLVLIAMYMLDLCVLFTLRLACT